MSLTEFLLNDWRKYSLESLGFSFSKPLWTCSYPTFTAWFILLQIPLMCDIQALMTVLKMNQWYLHTVLLFPFPYFCWQIISVSEHLSLLFYRPSSCCMTGQLLQDFFLFLWLLIWVTRVWLSPFVFWMLLSISFSTSLSLLFLRLHESADVYLCVNTNREFTASAQFSSFMDDGALNPCMFSPQRIRSDHFLSSNLIPFSKT